MPSVQLRSFGGLNTDSHVQDIRNGDYTDAKNIEHVSAEKGESMAITPRTGNEFAFNIGTVEAQNKEYRITFYFSDTTRCELKFTRPNRKSPLLIGVDDVNVPDVLNFQSQIESLFSSYSYNIDVTVDYQDSDKISYLFTPNQSDERLRYYDFYIESVGSSFVEVEVTKEAISTSRQGDLEVIGSTDLLGDLFVISSSKRSESFDKQIDQFFIVENGGLNGFTLSDYEPGTIYKGQEIYITGLTGSNANGAQAAQANGLYIIYDIFINPSDDIITIYTSSQSTGLGQLQISGTGGKITFDPFGFGEIGVAVKNQSRNEWTYTRLLRSKELNLWVKYRCDVESEISTLRKSIYFTDNYNQPKVFYYSQYAEYIEDGAIKSINPEVGTYSYGQVNQQTNHFLSTASTFNIDFVSQSQGGQLQSGNIRYFVRAVFNDGSSSNWSLPSRPIPVFDASTSIPYLIKGDVPGVVTSKKNTIKITGFDPALVNKVQVAAINYLDIGIQTTEPFGIIGTFPVSGLSDELIVTHSGGETGIDLIPEELSIQSQFYVTAKNNLIIDNRYILSNLQVNDFDYSDIVDQFTYSIEKKEISRSNCKFTSAGLVFTYGGYQDPSNVFYNTGYMINETYRFGVRFVLKNGNISNVYNIFPSDVTINTDDTSPDGKRISGLSDYSLVVDDTSSDDLDRNYVPYVRIYSPPLSSIVLNGFVASDIIERIEIFRVELTQVNETIKGCGLAIGCATVNAADPYSETAPQNVDYSIVFKKNTTQPYIIEKPLYSSTSLDFTDHVSVVNAAAIYLTDDNLNAYETNSVVPIGEGDYIYNYGQPVLFQQTGFAKNSSMGLKTSGPCTGLQKTEITSSALCLPDDEKIISLSPSATTTAAKKYGVVIKNGQRYIDGTINPLMVTNYPYTPGNPGGLFFTNYIKLKYNGNNFVEYSIGAYGGISNDEFITIVNASGGPVTCTGLGADQIRFLLNTTFLTPPAGRLEFWLDSDFPGWTQTLIEDYGIFDQTLPVGSVAYDNLFSSKPSYMVSFGAGTNNFNIPNNDTSPLLILRPSGNPVQIDRSIRYVQIKRDVADQYPEDAILNYVYTGSYIDASTVDYVDVLGGDTMTVTSFIKTFTMTSPPPASIIASNDYRYSQALWYTSQTKKNVHLNNDTDTYKIFPQSYSQNNNGFNTWIAQNYFDVNPYNNGYSQSDLYYGYRANAISRFSRNDFKTRIIYSDIKAQGSFTDSYRTFGLLSYTDLDASFGEIVDMKNVNGELFTLQPDKYQRQFFNTRGTLQLSDTSQIVLGDASVLSRPGVTITSFGCSNKWSCFLGKSDGGSDVVYWYDKTRKKFVRFGMDGTVSISDRAFTRTASADDLKWILDYDSASLNYGMHGVWNQRLGEAIWTIRAHRKPDHVWIEFVVGKSKIEKFSVGDIVYLEDETNFLNFEQTIVLYVVVQDYFTSQNIRPGVDPRWEDYFSRPSIDDTNYYNINTISYSEFKNRFIQFQETYHPRIYLQWSDTFLSPRPKDPESNVYEHNAGEILRWYAHNGEVQEEEGFIEVVFNIDPNVTKRYVALICNSEYTPYRLELETRTQTTVINGPEFEQQLEQFFAPIPNVEVNGQTDLDEDFMYGQWVKIRFFYQPGEFQRFTNIVLKFNPMVRLWNT